MQNNIGFGFKRSREEIRKIKDLIEQTTGDLEQFACQTIKFDPDIHATLRFSARKLNYFSRQTDKTQQNWGQMKLFMCLLEFLTLFYKESKHPNPKLVYVGAAPGQGITLIADMFPKFEFHLYDSQPFDAKLIEKSKMSGSKITIYQRYFEDADVQEFAGQESVFFMSDIRSLGYNVETNLVTKAGEELVWGDMQLQESWVEAIKPEWAQLKFRPPYYDEITKKMFNGESFEYLSGLIFYQSFVKPSSSETRLVINGKRLAKMSYNFKDYEKIIMYHNTIVREMEFTKFYNPISGLDVVLEDRETGILPNWDITKALWLIKTYLIKVGIQPTEDIVLGLMYKIDDYLIERGGALRETRGLKMKKSIGLKELAK